MSGQQDVIDFLSEPSHHAGADSVRRIDTHSAYVFLAGELAYKLKRAVTYGFLDFSTLDKRREACEAEVRINRRTAPSVYLRAEAITRDDAGRLAFGGAGEPLDWVVVMRCFDEDGLYDRLASQHLLTRPMVLELADEVRALHAAADLRPDFGGVASMTWVVERNGAVFEELSAILPADAASRVTKTSLDAIARNASLLESRRLSGHVRQCHGDLHLRNIVSIDNRPTLFDAIEFNDRIACTDVLYDLAFLVMDLLQFKMPGDASALFNRYLERSNEIDGLALMPLFLSCRAAVRAKVTALEARITGGRMTGGVSNPSGLPNAHAEQDKELARAYLDQAESFFQFSPPRLIAVGGLSGSGKSTLAARLAPGMGSAPGAVVVRSDVIRKQLCGVTPETRLGPDGYTPAMNRKVYNAMIARVRAVLAAGYCAIADAAFANADDRAAIEQVARDAGVPFTGFWLHASPEVLRARVSSRANDASDATGGIVDRQLASAEAVSDWRMVDAMGTEGETETSALMATEGNIPIS